MVQIIAATFKDGVFKPDRQPALSDSTRVRLVVEALDSSDTTEHADAWTALEQFWKSSRLTSDGERPNRDQLHERR